jgi:hypothetical protein
MSPWRFLLVFALAFGSVLPHCAAATPAMMSATNHAGMAHKQQQPSKAHIADACIGCATPVRFALASPVEPMAATGRYIAFHPTLTTRVTALDPPPPRQDA